MNATTSEQVINGEEALALLREGKESFNLWRTLNKRAVLDLTGSDLSGYDLSEYDLSGPAPGIREAWEPTAILRGCTLRKLDNARLWGSDLTGANFAGALCRGRAGGSDQSFLLANLSGANLERADFSYNALISANLAGSRLCGAIFFATNMQNVQGLVSARHVGCARWYGARGLSAENRGYILRLVFLALESSWTDYGETRLNHLAGGKV